MPNTLVLSHANDIDGLGSAALLRIRYAIPLKNIFFTSYSDEGLLQAEAHIKRMCKKGTTLFISDLSAVSFRELFLRVLIDVKSKGGRIIIFDHHFWPEGLVKEVAALCDIAVVGENAQACATEITQSYVKIGGAFASKFVRVVHHADFALKEKSLDGLIGIYAQSIGCCNLSKNYDERIRRLRHIVAVISSKKFYDEDMVNDARDFDKINQERIRRMLKSVHVICGKIAIGFSEQVDSNDACASLMKQNASDIAIVANIDRGSVSVRSRKGNIRPLVEAFGGGGHDHAAGFQIPKGYDLRKEACRKLLVKRIEKEARKLRLIPR